MKKHLAITCSFVLTLALSACIGGTAEVQESEASNDVFAPESTGSDIVAGIESEASENEAPSPSLTIPLKWPDVPATRGVPEPEFGTEPVEVHVGEHFAFLAYENVTEDEAMSYIEALRNAGFTFEESETTLPAGFEFYAQNNEVLDLGTSAKVTFTNEGVFTIELINYASVH